MTAVPPEELAGLEPPSAAVIDAAYQALAGDRQTPPVTAAPWNR